MPSLAREDLSRVGRSFQVVGVISLGHFFSHFYYLVLPPLFPLLKQALEVDYTSLGLAITAYSIVAALAQAPIGFVVDRFNPALVLAAGLTLCSLSVMAVGVFPHYGALIVFMLLLGLGDSVFHPADYVILSRSVESHQTGRAFSAHAFAGHLGFAAAPVTVLTLTSWFGWRAALVVCGVGGLLVAVIVLFKRHLLSGSRSPVTPTREGGESPGGGGMAVLLSWPMVLGLVFFVGISLSGTGVRDFGVSTLHLLYQAPLAQAGTVISAFLFAAPVGVLLGAVGRGSHQPARSGSSRRVGIIGGGCLHRGRDHSCPSAGGPVARGSRTFHWPDGTFTGYVDSIFDATRSHWQSLWLRLQWAKPRRNSRAGDARLCSRSCSPVMGLLDNRIVFFDDARLRARPGAFSIE